MERPERRRELIHGRHRRADEERGQDIVDGVLIVVFLVEPHLVVRTEYIHMGTEWAWRGAMRHVTKSPTMICPVRPSSQRKLRRPIKLVFLAPSKVALPQWEFFSSGSSGTSRKAQGCSTQTKNHLWRKSSTFFVTEVMALLSLQDMGM